MNYALPCKDKLLHTNSMETTYVNVWVGNVYRSLYEGVHQILQVLVNYMGMDIVIYTGATAL